MNTGLYNAGPLFTEGEFAQRKKEGVDLRTKINKNITIYNPADYDFNGAGTVRTNKMIFDYDNSTIQKSNYAIFNFDTTDAGTIQEFGMFIQRAWEHDDIYIVVKLTDFRNRIAIAYGDFPGYALNGFSSGTFRNEKFMNAKPLPQIYVVNSSDDAIETINAIDDVLKTGKKVDPIEFHKKYSKGLYVWENYDMFPQK